MKKVTAGRDALNEFAPKFAELNDDILFGEVWSRENELSARDRSLVTVTALMAQGLCDSSFEHHLKTAKEIWNESDTRSDKQNHANAMIFPIGEPNIAFSKYFIGQSYLTPLSQNQVGIFNVTFEPSCRNNWHIHKADKGGGQILICVAGKGYYQEWGKDVQILLPGDVVNIAPGIKHWHGAAKDSWFSHLAIEVPGENTSTEWCEEVNSESYNNIKL